MKYIPTVYYHSIGNIKSNWPRKFLTTDYNLFERQMKYLKKKYTFITIQDYWKIRNNLKESPKNPLLLTIDDGFLDNWVWMFPIILKLNIPTTIFISPEFIDNETSKIRLNSEERKELNSSQSSISEEFGYLSWDEIRHMQKSGLVDFQSHTMTHTKYFVSNKITDFHHPSSDCLYQIGNIYPERKPYYIEDPLFEKLIPYGFPYFEHKSAIIAKRVFINENFINDCINSLSDYDFTNYDFETAFKKVSQVYNEYKAQSNIIENIETNDEYVERLNYEIVSSKEIIEKELGNKVEFMCWPHGDNNQTAHDIAISNGYKATTIGKAHITDSPDRISTRFGLANYKGSFNLGMIKFNAKVRDKKNDPLMQFVKKMYRLTKK